MFVNIKITFSNIKIHAILRVCKGVLLRTDIKRSRTRALLQVILNYSPSNCFFFASNSSCVITPLSSNSLKFFNSSAVPSVAPFTFSPFGVETYCVSFAVAILFILSCNKIGGIIGTKIAKIKHNVAISEEIPFAAAILSTRCAVLYVQ